MGPNHVVNFWIVKDSSFVANYPTRQDYFNNYLECDLECNLNYREHMIITLNV